MVKSLNNLMTPQPLRDVRLAGPSQLYVASPAPDAGTSDELLQAREQLGYERGLHEAGDEYEGRLKSLRAELDNTRRNGVTNLLDLLEKSVQTQISRRLHDLEGELIELSTEAAIRLVNGVPINTAMIEGVIREAVSNAEMNTEAMVFLHPDDLKLLQDDNSELLGAAPHHRRLKFVVDEKIARGGCVVDTDCGLIDGQRQTRIDLLRKTIGS